MSKVTVHPVISKTLQELGNLNIPVRYGQDGLSFTVCNEHGRHLEIGDLESKSIFLMERGSCDISDNISICYQVHSCKQIRSCSYSSNVTTHFVAGN